MIRYIAFLGSINVGGNRVKMADLRAALEEEEFEDVETVVASGNVLFTHEERPSEGLTGKLEWVLEDRFDIQGMAVVRTREELVSAIENNPFHGTGEEQGSAFGQDKFVHTIFLEGQPEQADFDALLEEHKEKGSERLAIGDRCLFLDYVHGVGFSSLTGAFLERRLRCRGTARNMRSLKRILAKMDEHAD